MSNAWWKSSVVYQIYPRSFQDADGDGIGDLRGIMSRLPYLHELGVDLLWLCPVYLSPQDDNGYDISDYQAIDPSYGTMEDMRELVRSAQSLGIRILLDLVVNHTSDEHPWFRDSRSSVTSTKRDWYLWKSPVDGHEPTQWTSIFGGSVWEFDQSTGEFYFHTFSRRQPDLNWENPRVREGVYTMMNWWCDLGIAGFRVDAITFIKKNPEWPVTLPSLPKSASVLDGGCCNQPGILTFLREMRDTVLAPRDLVTVAESPGVAPEEMADYMGSQNGVFSMIFTFDHVDIDLRNQPSNEVGTWTLQEWKATFFDWQQAVASDGWLGLYLENHDQVRSVSKFGQAGPWREISAQALATWYFLMRGTPFIYQGQELGMTNAPWDSIEDYRDVFAHNLYRAAIQQGRSTRPVLDFLAVRGRDHSRTPMPWNGEVNAGFTTGTPWIGLNPDFPSVNVVADRESPHSVWRHYQALTRLRRQNSVFVQGAFDPFWSDSGELGAYRRRLGSQNVAVIVNFTSQRQVLPEIVTGRILLATGGRVERGTLAPWQAVVLEETP